MWIRSQDLLRLVKCDSVYIHYKNRTELCGGTYTDEFPLGKYPTEERALEVMDEIQEHLINSSYRPYQMPQK